MIRAYAWLAFAFALATVGSMVTATISPVLYVAWLIFCLPLGFWAGAVIAHAQLQRKRRRRD